MLLHSTILSRVRAQSEIKKASGPNGAPPKKSMPILLPVFLEPFEQSLGQITIQAIGSLSHLIPRKLRSNFDQMIVRH